MIFEEEWKDNKRKYLRNSGQQYVNRGGKTVEAKSFTPITKPCCVENCYMKFEVETQIILNRKFYKDNKQLQDIFLSSCIKKKKRKTKKPSPSKKSRPNGWSYCININTNAKFVVCRSFLMSLYQISEKRLRIIQKKMVNSNENSFCEQRGRHLNRPHRLKANVTELFMEHLNTIPSRSSHYSPSQRKYFDNPDLTKLKLYNLFKEYYLERTGEQLKLHYKTYVKIFRVRSNYSFNKPRTDVCNDCSKFEVAINPTEDEISQHEEHLKAVEEYKALKNFYLTEAAKNTDYLVLEFDYSQNISLPKLNVNTQYYKRQLNMYLFNVHNHNTGDSSMYLFTENQANKNPNSVASFIFHYLQQFFRNEKQTYRTIVLFSDAAGSQNKNITMVRFEQWLSKVTSTEVLHVYPVRGHSYNQCDRNFALFRRKVRNIERIVDPRIYFEKIVECRQNPKPFNLIYDPSILEDWNAALMDMFQNNPKSIERGGVSGRKFITFKIMSYVALKFQPDYFQVFLSFNACFQQHLFRNVDDRNDSICFVFWKQSTLENETFRELNLPKAPRPGINADTLKDLEELFKFFTSEEVLNFKTIVGL